MQAWDEAQRGTAMGGRVGERGGMQEYMRVCTEAMVEGERGLCLAVTCFLVSLVRRYLDGTQISSVEAGTFAGLGNLVYL